MHALLIPKNKSDEMSSGAPYCFIYFALPSFALHFLLASPVLELLDHQTIYFTPFQQAELLYTLL